METFEPMQMPQFKSPQEEIEFLRAQIAQKEKNLTSAGIETSREKIAENTLLEYKEKTQKEVLHKDIRIAEKEVTKLALRLSPETHDRIMEELLGILLDKGIKNALIVAEKLNNPHVDDDFHRFLVQYLQTTGAIPGLKESTALYRALDCTLFEISLPEVTDDKKKGLKELLTMMEQFYAGMHSIGMTRQNSERNHFTIEIALSNAGEQFVIYAAIPSKRADLFEKQLLSIHPDAKIIEVVDDYNIFIDDKDTAVGAYAHLSHPDVYPIKTYDSFDHDPMNLILNSFSKLKAEGEGVAIQFIMCPKDDEIIHHYQQTLDYLKKGYNLKNAQSGFRRFGNDLLKMGEDFVMGFDRKESEKKVNERAVEYLTEKLKSTIMATNIRIMASAETRLRSEQIVDEVSASFNQFTEAGRNGISWTKVSGGALRELEHEFSFRLFDDEHAMPFNLKELATIFHFPYGIAKMGQLKQAKASTAPVSLDMPTAQPAGSILLGYNEYRGLQKPVYLSREDRFRHFYVIGQTGTGKTVFLKDMIIQDIKNGDGCCFIDPHGTDIQDILAHIPKERLDDVIYFDPAYTARPMGLNMLEFDERYPEQKTFVVNELINIFNQLFDMKTSGGPMFEQYFRNSCLLVMEDPESGMTLLEIGRVLADKEFRDLKLSRCRNPIIKQFWENAERTTGESSLANFVPYITNKFDVFISNDIMRPVIAQEKSVFNFRKIMDEKKILLVNLAKGRLGEINANLIGLILVGKIQMAALSRVDMFGQKMSDFFLYIDEFQNVTTDSIESILSEARKYRLSLNVAHQYVEQLKENIRNAIFGNVGSMAIHRVSPENAEIFAKQLEPTFTAQDIIKQENLNCYIKMLIGGIPAKPFNSHTPFPPKGNTEIVESIKELSYLKYGRERAEVEEEIMSRYKAGQ